MMDAVKLKPAYKNYLWGGNTLRNQYGKQADFAGPIAESWELSCHPDGLCTVNSGEHAGMSLPEYIKLLGAGSLGERGKAHAEDFPILIKLIDAAQTLSIQVHPDENYAQRTENSHGKTEMWYVVDALPNAELIYGFKESVSAEAFRESIETGTVESLLNHVKVAPGDVFFIEAGTIHAIGAGLLIAEIQQSSNTTYRVFDYNRTDAQGKSRELHIEKALDVTLREPPKRPIGSQGETQAADGCNVTLLAECNWFKSELMDLPPSGQTSITAGSRSFLCLLSVGGAGILAADGEELAINKGESVFIPANTGRYTFTGHGKFILTGL